MMRQAVATGLVLLSMVAFAVVICLLYLLAGWHWLLGPLSPINGEPRDPSILHRIFGVGLIALAIAFGSAFVTEAGRMAVGALRDRRHGVGALPRRRDRPAAAHRGDEGGGATMQAIRVFGRGILWVVGAEFMLFGAIFAVVTLVWGLELTTNQDKGRPLSAAVIFVINLFVMSSAQAWLGWKLVRRPPHAKTPRLTTGICGHDAERQHLDRA